MIAVLVHVLALLAMPFLLFERVAPIYRWRARFGLLAFVIAVLIFLLSGIALAFPENVRHGYPSCAACHVAGAAGAGAPTPYGRSAGAEVMPTWKAAGEEGPLFGLAPELPDWFAYGGDARYINVNGSRHVKFWMQRDLEAAAEVVKGLTVGASVGVYGPLQAVEFRKSYAKLALGNHVTLRAGRFIGAYGISMADHRLPTRAGLGLGQGSESYNAEATIASRFGEVTFTEIHGSAAAIDASAAKGYGIHPRGRHGSMVRVAAFLGGRTQLGMSAMRASDMHAYGAHLITGSKAWFLIAEYDRRFPDAVDIAIGKAGWEPVRGVHIGPLAQWNGFRSQYGAFATWFPRPHLELSAQVERVVEEYESVFMFHYYL